MRFGKIHNICKTKTMQKSNEWAFTMELKKHLSSDVSKENVLLLANVLVTKITRLIKDMGASKKYDADDVDQITSELEDSKSNFEHLATLCDGTIPKSDWSEFGFDGDFCQEFNYYLEDLYDIADNRILDKNKTITYKLLWIK
jgi:hypothetical protein